MPLNITPNEALMLITFGLLMIAPNICKIVNALVAEEE
jgi:hypothetical protein